MRILCAVTLVVLLGAMWVSVAVWGCWGCEDIGSTFAQEIKRSDVVVIATVVPADGKKEDSAASADVKPDSDATADGDSDFRSARLRVSRFVKDSMQIQRGDEFTVSTNQTLKADGRYLLMGFGKKKTTWTAPLELSESAERYLFDGLWAPKEGAGRLAFFLPFLDDKNPVIAEDAYKEFAKVPYKEVKELREKLDRKHLLERLQDEQLATRLRRLYLTLLGICGTPEDGATILPFLDRREKTFVDSLDTTIACYLTLRGAGGIDAIESRFFIDTKTDKRHTQAAIRALQFHMTEEELVPRDRVLAAAHQLLDRPDMADLIIDDLIRWEDWTVSDKLVKLFKNADKETGFVRKPVIHYLKACPLPESLPLIEQLRTIDPMAVEMAELTFAGSGLGKVPEPTATTAAEPAKQEVPKSSAEAPPRPPLVHQNVIVTHSFQAGRMFSLALLSLAAGIALTAVWFLVRTPHRK